MKRDELEKLGLTEEQINSVMDLNGKDVNKTKASFADYDTIKDQLEKANATLEKFKDYDNVKADVEKYKAEAEQSKKDYEAKVQTMERQGKIKDYTNSMKFVNDFTRDAINKQIEEALADPKNTKGIEEIFKGLTDGKDGILADEKKPTPPKVPNMGNNDDKADGVLAAFQRLNPNLKLN